MPTVLFLPYHGTGHFNPCFSMAATLQKHGYEVHFAGVEFFRNHVAAQGYHYFPMRSVPFGSGFERWLNEVEKKKHLCLAELKDRLTNRLYTLRENDYVKILDSSRPDIVLLDAVQSTDFIVLYPLLKARNIRIGIIHAMLPTAIKPGRPPGNSDLFPDDPEGYRHAVRIVKRKKRIKSLKQKLRFLGRDDLSLIHSRLIRNNVPESYYKPPVLTLTHFAVRHIDEFILTPREFDFPAFEEEPKQHYIGFQVDSRRNDSPPQEYLSIKDSLFDTQNNPDLKFIYCSFGTLEADEKEAVVSFLCKLINAVRDRPYRLIVSTKMQLDAAGIPENVYLFTSVPQLEVLAHVDLFITHGGLGSIKESILAEVPMLMFPVHADYDPRGNAARVAYHGLGLRGNALQDTEEDIHNKIEELLNNPRYKENVRALKEANSGYTTEKFIAAFNKIAALI